jgi:hypothetical protein
MYFEKSSLQYGVTTLSITTFSIMTLSISTFSTKSLSVTFSITTQHKNTLC